MKIIFVFLLLFSSLFADGKSHHFGKDLTFLNLSKTQEKQISKILIEYRKSIQKYRDYKKTIVYKQQNLFLKEVFDEKKFKELNLQLSSATTEKQSSLLQKIHVLLTKKQKQKFINYIEEWEFE